MNPLVLLEKISQQHEKILGQKLVGIYVHGSIAFGCFHWQRSDIDFLTVVSAPLSLKEKTALLFSLLALDSKAPPKGFEMSVVLSEVCRYFQYPTPYELHFSNTHKNRYLADPEGYCRSSYGNDPDLAAHFTVIQEVGFPVFGPPISEIFAPVPQENYWDSICRDIQDAADTIQHDPVYVILNLCRVMAYRRDRLILSKEQGGTWALAHLPSVFHPPVLGALTFYRDGTPFSFVPDVLQQFAAWALKEIFASQD